MKIFVKVKANAKRNEVKRVDDTHFLVSVSELPINNKANLAVIKSLAEYFQISRSKIILLHGTKSKQKTFLLE